MTRSTFFSLAAAGLVSALACSGGDQKRTSDSGAASASPTARGGLDLTGAGATFPYPIYSKWISDYSAKTGIKINYQAIGSGGGIRQLSEGTVDFAGSDAPMTDDELAKAKGGPILHFPSVLGAVVLTYNLPDLTQPLSLSGEVVADIFLGKITKWNDRRIAQLNPGAKLPAGDIIVTHRSDGSGTSYIFTDYLSKVSPEWSTRVGKNTSVSWPVGLGGKGNEGVTQQVKQNPGSIGYVELIYAVSNKLPYAQVKNASGAFVEPSLASVSAAAAGADLGANTDFRVSITNAPGAAAYPISSFTWLLVRKDGKDVAKAKLIKDFLTWMIGADAQKMAAELEYAPLPAEVVALVKARLPTLKAGGKTLATN